MPLQGAQTQPGQVPRKVGRQEKARTQRGYGAPQAQRQRRLKPELPRNAEPPPHPRMMRQVTVPPERLRNPQENAQGGGEQSVHARRAEKRPVNEVMCDGI